jgi:hypothetical protein
MNMTDSWMTWAARPEELGAPLGLVRHAQTWRERNLEKGEFQEGEFQEGEFQKGEFQEGEFQEGAFASTSVEFDPPPLCDRPATAGCELSRSRLTHELNLRSTTPAHSIPAQTHRTTSRWLSSVGASKRVLAVLAAVGLVGTSLLTMPGCQTVMPIAINAAVVACVELVKALFDNPNETLPAGYAPCGQMVWPVQDHELKFCLYCDPSKPQELFVQFGCEGKYYPMRLRRFEHIPALPDGENIDELSSEYISIEKLKCDEQFLADAAATVAPYMSALDCAIRVPNDRVLPTTGDYKTLEVRIGGVPAPRDRDFEIEGGSLLELSGCFDEVAHYAMVCGVRALTFKDGSQQWSVYANPDVSAIAVFRGNELYDARFLFAPQPEVHHGG